MTGGGTAPDSVHLGYVGRPLRGEEQLDVRLSRMGGRPAWLQRPDGSPLSSVGTSTCGVCRRPLMFVGQLSAGYEQVPLRLLHVFACSFPSCSAGADPRTWRVFRSTAPPKGFVAEGNAANVVAGDTSGNTGVNDPVVVDTACGHWGIAAGGDDWGLPAGDSWGVGRSGGNSSSCTQEDWGFASTTSTPDVDMEIETLLDARSLKCAGKLPMVSSKVVDASSVELERTEEDASVWQGVQEPSLDSGQDTLCFALEIWDEPPEAAASNSGEHERELLERYRNSEFASEEDGSIPLPPELAAEMAELATEVEDVAEAALDIEADEEEDSFTVDGKWLFKFQQRLERSPAQVVRYVWGGSPLWMSQPPPEVLKGAWPPPCSRCGARRVFEFQVLPTLCHKMRYAAEDDGAEVEWGTAVVYTCSGDCSSEEPCDEFVVVQPSA